MTSRVWDAVELSRELGFGRSAPPRFWRWCQARDLRPTVGDMGFRDDHVQLARRGKSIDYYPDDLDDCEDLD